MARLTVREKDEDRNERIKEHYWKLWGLEDSNSGQGPSDLQADKIFEGEQVTISREEIQEFCKGSSRPKPQHVFFFQDTG